jgi:hypothetical protein
MLHAQRHADLSHSPFGRRVNCEQVPLLPASVVAWILDDSEEVPCVLVWKDSSGTVQESVHVAPDAEIGAVEIKRGDGTPEIIDTLLRPLPRNGGSVRLLICPYCQTPRRGLYGWEPGGRFTSSAVRSSWGCRACNHLRYASEGGALVHRGRGRLGRMLEATFGRSRSERPKPWYPEIFRVARQSGTSLTVLDPLAALPHCAV